MQAWELSFLGMRNGLEDDGLGVGVNDTFLESAAEPPSLWPFGLWCNLPRDVGTLTFCQLMGFPN